MADLPPLPGSGSATSSGSENDAVHVVLPAPALPVPLLLLPNARAGLGSPQPVPTAVLSPYSHRAAWLTQMPPTEAGTGGAGTPQHYCGLGTPGRAWRMGCGHEAVTCAREGRGRHGPRGCQLLQTAERGQIRSTAGRVCSLWAQAAPPVPEGPGVSPRALTGDTSRSKEDGGSGQTRPPAAGLRGAPAASW